MFTLRISHTHYVQICMRPRAAVVLLSFIALAAYPPARDRHGRGRRKRFTAVPHFLAAAGRDRVSSGESGTKPSAVAARCCAYMGRM